MVGYQFNLEELQEHMEDGIPLAEDQLDTVAGGIDGIERYNQFRENSIKLTLSGKGDEGAECFIKLHNLDIF